MVSDVSAKDEWQEMLNRALEGDAEALGTLCQHHLRQKTFSFALKFLKNPHDAEDVVQEVFERLINNYQRITARELRRFEAFVITMTKNVCIDWKRTQKPTESIVEEHSGGNTTQEEIFRKEMLNVLYNILQQALNEDERKIFTMRVVEELSYQKIADSLDIKLTTLYYQYKTMLSRIGKNADLRSYWEDIKES